MGLTKPINQFRICQLPRQGAPKMKKAWNDRRKQAADLRQEGLSYAKIGRLLDPPISAQAVHKLINRTDEGHRKVKKK